MYHSTLDSRAFQDLIETCEEEEEKGEGGVQARRRSIYSQFLKCVLTFGDQFLQSQFGWLESDFLVFSKGPVVSNDT